MVGLFGSFWIFGPGGLFDLAATDGGGAPENCWLIITSDRSAGLVAHDRGVDR